LTALSSSVGNPVLRETSPNFDAMRRLYGVLSLLIYQQRNV